MCKKLLRENKENAYLSRQLATINTDVPIPKPNLSTPFWASDLRKAIPLLEEYEINSIKRKIELKYPETNTAKPQTEYQDDIFKEKEKTQEETEETDNKMPFTAILVNTLNFVTLLKE